MQVAYLKFKNMDAGQVKCMEAMPSKVECVNGPGKCDNTVSMRIWRALRAETRARESRLMASPRRACTVVAGYQKSGPGFEWLGTLWTMHFCIDLAALFSESSTWNCL